MHPHRMVKDSGSYACPPYIVEESLTYLELAKKLLKVLEFSEQANIPPSEEEQFFSKETINITGIKNMKSLHKESLNISVFTKEDKYHISPSINKGSRQGFHYTKDRIIIPLTSTIDELAVALEEAFARSK